MVEEPFDTLFSQWLLGVGTPSYVQEQEKVNQMLEKDPTVKNEWIKSMDASKEIAEKEKAKLVEQQLKWLPVLRCNICVVDVVSRIASVADHETIIKSDVAGPAVRLVFWANILLWSFYDVLPWLSYPLSVYHVLRKCEHGNFAPYIFFCALSDDCAVSCRHRTDGVGVRPASASVCYAEYRQPPSHCETYCWYNTLECDVDQIGEELTCEQRVERAEQHEQRLCSQFSEWLRTAKLSGMMVYRHVRKGISFCETSSVVLVLFGSLLSLSTRDTHVCVTHLFSSRKTLKPSFTLCSARRRACSLTARR